MLKKLNYKYNFVRVKKIIFINLIFFFFFLSFWGLYFFKKTLFFFENVDNVRFVELSFILIIFFFINLFIFITCFETCFLCFFCFDLIDNNIYIEYFLYKKLKRSLVLMFYCILYSYYFHNIYVIYFPLNEDPFWFNYFEYIHLKKDNNISWVYYDGSENFYTEKK